MRFTAIAPLLATVLSLAARQVAAIPLPHQHAERAELESAFSLWHLADYEPSVGKSAVLGQGSWAYSDGSAGGTVVQVVELDADETGDGYLVADGTEQPVGLFDLSSAATSRLMERAVCCTTYICRYRVIKTCAE